MTITTTTIPVPLFLGGDSGRNCARCVRCWQNNNKFHQHYNNRYYYASILYIAVSVIFGCCFIPGSMYSYVSAVAVATSTITTATTSASNTNHNNNNNNAFNTQIMSRVTERLDGFLIVPLDAAQRLLELRNNAGGIFPNGMTSADHTAVYSYLLMETKSKTTVYFALEDGTFMYSFNVNATYHREPGNAYVVDNDDYYQYNVNNSTLIVENTTTAMKDLNYIHFNSCINKEKNFEPTQCIATNGTKYITCVDNCTLVPCASLFATTSSNISSSSSISIDDTTSAETTPWCTNYQIKTVNNETDTDIIGYVPQVLRCINRHGQPEQRPGYVVVFPKNNTNNTTTTTTTNHDEIGLGNCYYADGKTMINRTINGPFVACGTSNPSSSSNNKKTCSLPYTGVTSTGTFDPRYRGWYIDTKQKQKPTWTAPYLYSSGSRMGITYGQPMYNDIVQLTDDEDNNDNDSTTTTTKKIFQGVIAVDYTLNQINDFLTYHYSNTNMQVLVVERTEPYHYLIATSTKHGNVLKLVLRTNTTQTCPHNESVLINTQYPINPSSPCILGRVSIYEFVNPIGPSSTTAITSNLNDDEIQELNRANLVLYRAFMAHKENGFPQDDNEQDESSRSSTGTSSSSSRLNIKESPTMIGSPAYSTKGQLYQLRTSVQSLSATEDDATVTSSADTDNNNNNEFIQWQIIVVVPMPRSTQDAIVRGSNSFVLVCMIASIGFLLCFLTFVQFYNYRKEKAMIHSDYRFTCAFIIGCTVLNVSTFTLLGDNTNATCMIRMWSFNGLFACTISPLFVKVWRMYQLLRVEISYQRRQTLSNIRAIVYTIPIIAIQVCILSIYSIVDPPLQTEKLGFGVDDTTTSSNSDEGIGYQQITCQQQTNAFFYTQVVYDALLVFIGCVLAYKTKDLDPKFGEAKQLGFSMYNITFTGIVVVLTIRFVNFDRASEIIIQAIGIFWGSFFSSLAFVLPRFIEVQQEKIQYKRSSQYNEQHDVETLSGAAMNLVRTNSSVPNNVIDDCGDNKEVEHRTAQQPTLVVDADDNDDNNYNHIQNDININNNGTNNSDDHEKNGPVNKELLKNQNVPLPMVASSLLLSSSSSSIKNASWSEHHQDTNGNSAKQKKTIKDGRNTTTSSDPHVSSTQDSTSTTETIKQHEQFITNDANNNNNNNSYTRTDPRKIPNTLSESLQSNVTIAFDSTGTSE